MRVIGLAGGIASGKTMITEYLASLGAPVLDADVLARQLTAPGSPALAEIAAAFGEDYLDETGALRRKELGRLIFRDKESRLALNRILHPKIGAAVRAGLRAMEAAGERAVIYAAPLLLENGVDSFADEIWLMVAEPEIQLARLMARDGLDEGAARQRLAAQTSLREKMALADQLIDNSGSPAAARQKAKALWEAACGR